MAYLPKVTVLCTVRDPERLQVWIVHPRLAQIASLGLFTAGLALQSVHLGHDIFVDEHAQCECVAIDRSEGAVHVLPAGATVSGIDVAPSTATLAVPTRDPEICYGARAPPSA